MADLDKKRIEDRESLRTSLLGLYTKAGKYVLAVVFVFVILDLIFNFSATLIQRIVAWYCVIGIGIPIAFQNKSWMRKIIVYTHVFMISGIVGIYAIDYFLEPGIDQLLTLFLGIYLAGIFIIRTRLTIIFFALVSVLMGFIFVNQELELKYVAYYVLMAGSIIGLHFWRDSLNQNLKLSNRTYRDLFGQSTELIFVLSENFEIIEINKAANDYLENRMKGQVYGLKFNELFCPKTESDRGKLFKAVDEISAGSKQARIECECDIQGDGGHEPKEFTVSKGDYFNQPVFIISIRLIADRKEYEKRLIEGKEKMSQVLENINSFVFNISFNDNGTTVVNFVSDKVKEIYGIDVDEYITRVKSGRVSEIFDPRDLENLDAMVEEAISTVQPKVALSRITRDGKRRWIEEKFFPQKQEGAISLFGLVTDVTEREEASRKLADSEKRYREIFERNLAGVYKTHVDGTILDCNASFARILGYDKPEDLIQKNVEEIYHSIADRKPYIERLRKEGSLNNHISKLVNKNGEEMTLNNNVSIFPDENGELNIIEGTLIDVTEQVAYETELNRNKESFKNIVDHSPAAILIFTEDKLVYKNPLGEEMLDDLLESDRETLLDVFPKNHRFLIQDLLEDAKNDINSYTEIDLGEGKRKKKYSINVVNTTYNNKESQLFMLRDITLQNEYNVQKLRAEVAEETNKMLQEEIARHRETQASLLEKTSKLNALFEGSANLHIVSLDKDFRLTGQNQNFIKFMNEEMGIKVEVGAPFLDYFKSTKLGEKKIKDKFNRAFKGEHLEMISHFPGPKKEFWMESFINPIILGDEINEISFISHNITEKVETEQKAKLSELNNKAILLAMPDNLFKLNKEGYFTDIKISSENDRKLLEQVISTTDVKGKHVSEVFTDKEIGDEFFEHVENAIRSGNVLTHNYSFFYGEEDNHNKIFFENRYSKTTDDEVIVIARNITESVEYESRLLESVQEKEILLKEVHHRVKNNLQVINSILNLQSSYITDEKTLEIINESQNRIRSMSYIHEILYQTKDFSSINFADYMSNLIQNVVHTYEINEDKTEVVQKIKPVRLALDQAIPCGLILNELVSNALKYAYPKDKKGKIEIDVFEKDKKVHIKIKDFGVGLPPDFNIFETDSLGLSLVHTLVEQLDGELKIKTKEGTEFLIIFEKQQF